jgi:hypothetical protein
MHEKKQNHRDASLADLLAIQTLRSLEGDQPRFLPSVDLPLASEVDPRQIENPSTAVDVLARRANTVLRSEYGLGKSEIGKGLESLWWVRFAFIGFVAVSAAGLCGYVLQAKDETQPVSVEWFSRFLGLNLVMAIPPVLLMVAALIGHCSGNSKSGALGAVAQVLEHLGRILTVVFWAFHAGLRLVQRFLKPAFVSPVSPEKTERFADATRTLIADHSHLLLRVAAATSHLCWTVVCTLVLLFLLASTAFREYDFRWHSTWLDQSRKLHCLEAATAPIRRLPLTPIPDAELVTYLSSEASKTDQELLRFPLDTQIGDRGRAVTEREDALRTIGHQIEAIRTQDEAVAKLKREGIRAANDYLQAIHALVAAVHDDANLPHVVGDKGHEAIANLRNRVRELKATSEQRKVKAEELLLAGVGNGEPGETRAIFSNISDGANAVVKVLADITQNYQAAVRDANLRSKGRRTCVDLMAVFLLYYGILPRLLLLAIAQVQLRQSLRKLRPSLTSPYFMGIVNYLTAPPIGPSSESAEPEPATDGPVVPPLNMGDAPASSADEHHESMPAHEVVESVDREPSLPPTTVDEVSLPESPATSPPPALSAVFGYEVRVPANGWQDVVPVTGFGELLDLGNANDRISRTTVIDKLGRHATAIRCLTIVIDLNGSPDSQFVSFLHAAIASLGDTAPEIVVLLSGGERLRVKFSNDTDRIRTRVLLWREELSRAGVREDRIFEYDHYLPIANSRQNLLTQFQGVLGKPVSDVPSSSSVRLAGKFSQASRLICDTARRVTACGDADRYTIETRELHQKIHELYQQDATWLAQACAAVGCTPGSLPSMVATAGSLASDAMDELQDGVSSLPNVDRDRLRQAMQWRSCFRGYVGELSGHWVIAGGLAAALAGSLAGVPAMASVWLFGAGAALGSQLPSLKQKLICLLPAAGNRAAEPAENHASMGTVCLDDLVRVNVVWAIVLELQGNSEEVIAKTLNWLLGNRHHEPIDSLDKTQELLRELEACLNQLPANGKN